MSVRIHFGKADPMKRPRLWPVPAVFHLAHLRSSIRADIERQIALLDYLDSLDGDGDGDPDAEDDGTAEPSLGWTRTMATGDTRDIEEDRVPAGVS